jgi:hypothetical protein
MTGASALPGAILAAPARRATPELSSRIHERKGNVVGRARQLHAARAHASAGWARQQLGERIEQAQSPPFDHLLGRLHDGAEDAAHAARLVADRTVGEGEIRLLGAPVRASGSIRSSDQVASPVVRTWRSSGSMMLPDLRQHDRSRAAHRCGCFLGPTIGTRLWL